MIIGKDVLVDAAYLKLTCQNCQERGGENPNVLSRGRDVSPKPPEHEAAVISTTPVTVTDSDSENCRRNTACFSFFILYASTLLWNENIAVCLFVCSQFFFVL